MSKIVARAFNRNRSVAGDGAANGKFVASSLGFSRFSLSQSLRTHNENYREAENREKC